MSDSNAPSTKILDHIIHLTPPGSVQKTSEQFRQLGFNVIPGGTHTDGLTANALVVFQDGVYLELISFTHELSHYPPSSPEHAKRVSHFWASKLPGWIDYAFLDVSHPKRGDGRSVSDIINDRARSNGSNAKYLPEQPGGRKRADGQQLEWTTTTPDTSGGQSRGTLPFFCKDVTPRELRVPVDPPSNSHHSLTALGIAHVRILVKSAESFASSRKRLETVLGDPATVPAETTSTTCTLSDASWELDVVTLLPKSEAKKWVPQLILSLPRDEEERNAVETRGSGIYEVAIWAEIGEERSAKTPYGKIVWRPL